MLRADTVRVNQWFQDNPDLVKDLPKAHKAFLLEFATSILDCEDLDELMLFLYGFVQQSVSSGALDRYLPKIN
jgi:hypothetical protein